ncbi:hypothetical protein H5410_005060 [Solanum commersonii]|uniref:DUF4283 domain-containing protein n=1 Tax=Solanum commersonii TaxID=4109 RepID=A0A9J6A644_SOLCO|nr:hypothetical protein H5410_005060 [Solanum commersonii]
MGKRTRAPSLKAIMAKEAQERLEEAQREKQSTRVNKKGAQSNETGKTMQQGGIGIKSNTKESTEARSETRESMKQSELVNPMGNREAQQLWKEIAAVGIDGTEEPSNSGRKSWADEVEEMMEEPVKRSSIWDNFDIEKVVNAGFKLEYVAPSNTGKSVYVEIELNDISSEIEYWKNSVVCYVLGAHPPFEVIKGFIQRIWGKHGINKIVMLKNGVVLVRFDTGLGKNEVIQGGIYHFDSKPFIVKAWNPDMDFTREELHTVPIWIKFPGLDFKYWSPKGLSKLGSLIGKPLMVDQNTERKTGLNFARLMVEVDMDSTLPKMINFRNEKGQLIDQKVTYEWKPTLCKYCKKYGHCRGDMQEEEYAKT